MGQWVSGSVGQWVSGSVGQWVSGSVGQWVNGSNGSLFLVGQVDHGPGAENMMGQDGSKLTVISILQKRSTRSWCKHIGSSSMGVKKLPKLSKMALTVFVIQGSSAESERHQRTSYYHTTEKPTFAKCCWSYFCKFGKLQIFFASKFNFPSNTFLNQVRVMGQNSDGSSGSWVRAPMGRT